MKKQIIVTSLLFLFFFSWLSAIEPQQRDNNTHLITQKIADLNMRTFPWEHDSWEAHTTIEFVTKLTQRILNPKPKEKRETIFSLFKEIEKKQPPKTTTIDNSTAWNDLDLFYGKGKPQTFVANSLDRTSTELGKVCLYCTLAEPTTDTMVLKQRQVIIQTISENQEILNTLHTSLQAIAQSENALLLFWGVDQFEHVLEHETFTNPLLKKLKQYDTALLVNSLYTDASSGYSLILQAMAAATLLSYGILHATNIIDIPGWLKTKADQYHWRAPDILALLYDTPFLQNRFFHASLAIIAGLFCATNLKENFDNFYGKLLFEKSLQTIMTHIATVVTQMRNLNQIIKSNPSLEKFEEFKPLCNFFEKQPVSSQNFQELIDLLSDEQTFSGKSSFIAHKGFIIRSYMLMHELKSSFESALGALAKVDVYCSTAQLIKEQEQKHVHFCFPSYITQANTPCITIDKFWHPLISSDRAIPNSIELGTDNQRRNAIITGPNEGGKSTMLKAITLSLLLAQTLGIAPAQSMQFTPFSSIATYLNITDDTGSGQSLFKAEVVRAQELIERVKHSQPGVFNFAIFDEIFNGTSPIEGCAAAWSVAKHLGTFSNSICLIATHFALLTNLEKQTESFSNYKVSVEKQTNGTILYPYKLERGISTQHIALDILRNQGFASTIIDDAQIATIHLSQETRLGSC